jgi:hypothetical protein
LLRDPPRDRTDQQSYVHGTSRFLLANLFRRGGRYREAEQWIREAEALFDPRRPAQSTEQLQCRYALGVCSAVQGRPILQDLASTDDREVVFARSLVVLSNANAAWLIGDPDRASLDASTAANGFDSIGYTRYARRARWLATLLKQWATLEAGERRLSPDGADSGLLSQILSAGDHDQIDLSNQRPSAVLGLLAFGLEYARPGTRPQVLLPPVIAIDDLHLTQPRLTTGFDQADSQLRQDMGLPTGTRAPLLAD